MLSVVRKMNASGATVVRAMCSVPAKKTFILEYEYVEDILEKR
jgi:hypothetical protein